MNKLYSCKQHWLIRQYTCTTWCPVRDIWEHYKLSHNKSHVLWSSDTRWLPTPDVDLSVNIGSEKDSTSRDLESLPDTQECDSSLFFDSDCKTYRIICSWMSTCDTDLSWQTGFIHIIYQGFLLTVVTFVGPDLT